MKDNHLNSCSSLCGIIAVTQHKVLMDQYPIIQNVSFDNWMFFLSVLSFGLFKDAIHSSAFSKEDKENAIQENCADLIGKYPDFLKGLEHLAIFLSEPQNVNPQSLGFWLATNLFGKDSKTLSKEEFEVGVLATQMAMHDVSSFITK